MRIVWSTKADTEGNTKKSSRTCCIRDAGGRGNVLGTPGRTASKFQAEGENAAAERVLEVAVWAGAARK